MPKKSPAKWGRPASSHIADSDSGGLAVRLNKTFQGVSWVSEAFQVLTTPQTLVYLHEVSSGGFEEGSAQLIRPSQNNSLRMQCRLDEEQRLENQQLVSCYPPPITFFFLNSIVFFTCEWRHPCRRTS